jgi:hypothetical protein
MRPRKSGHCRAVYGDDITFSLPLAYEVLNRPQHAWPAVFAFDFGVHGAQVNQQGVVVDALAAGLFGSRLAALVAFLWLQKPLVLRPSTSQLIATGQTALCAVTQAHFVSVSSR